MRTVLESKAVEVRLRWEALVIPKRQALKQTTAYTERELVTCSSKAVCNAIFDSIKGSSVTKIVTTGINRFNDTFSYRRVKKSRAIARLISSKTPKSLTATCTSFQYSNQCRSCMIGFCPANVTGGCDLGCR